MLGLKITRVFQGYADLLEINGNPSWTKYVNDHRELLKNITNVGGSGSAILMLTSIETGHILTITTLIDGRTNDNISAWIYIPDTIDSSTREFAKSLTDIIAVVQNEFRATQLNVPMLQQVFAKQFAPAPAKRISVKSSGEKCAVRYYGIGVQYNLMEILQNLSQPYYHNYKAIFLLDRSSNIVCSNCDDLTSAKLAELVVVYPPATSNNFVPHIAGQPFTNPIYAAIGDNIEIDWIRTGYATIKKSSIVSASTQFIQPTRSEYRINYPYSAITVQDEKGKPIQGYTLRINNMLVKPGGNIEISEDIVTQSKVDVSADGYEAQQFVRDLRSNFTIKLKRSNLVYKFKVPSAIYPYPTLSFEISSKQPLAGCPLEGYALEDKKLDSISDNWLEYKPLTGKIKIWLTVLSCMALVIGAIGGWGATYAYFKLNTPKHTTKPKVETEKGQNWSKIKGYLEHKMVWDRNEMEEIDHILVELWDYMNNGELQKIIDMGSQYPNLKGSKNFCKVHNAVHDRILSGYKVNQPFKNNTFNANPKDKKITVRDFIDKMSERQPDNTHRENTGKGSPRTTGKGSPRTTGKGSPGKTGTGSGVDQSALN